MQLGRLSAALCCRAGPRLLWSAGRPPQDVVVLGEKVRGFFAGRGMERGKGKGERGREGGIRISDFGLGIAEGREIRMQIADFGLRNGEGESVGGPGLVLYAF